MTQSERAWERGDEMEAMRLRRVEMQAAAKEAARYAASTEGQAHAREVRINALIAMRVDSGLTAEQADELAALESQADQARKTAEAAIWAEWTKDVTIARRAAWNAMAVAACGPTGKGNAAIRAELERKAGHTAAALQRAIRHYGL